MGKPSGTVTFLFTDIEGSTRHLQEAGDGYVAILADHHRLIRAAITEHAGFEVDTEGDAFFVAFEKPSDAVAAAISAQRALARHGWPRSPVRVRMGIHSGQAMSTPTGYVGMAVHLAARVCAAAHGGQIVISRATRELLGGATGELAVKPLGRHRLKDMGDPQPLFQVCHPELDGDFPRLRTLGTDADALPAPATEVVGRADEVARLAAILLDGHSRLVTLTGPGGVGKTTLAIEAARACASHFEDGVFFVPLAAIEKADLVGSAISTALDAKDEAGQMIDLERMLRRRRALLVLDNFEHVIAATPLVAGLVASCPRLVILATSREVLRIRGEREHEVPTLPVPPGGAGNPDQVRKFAAVRLLEARARDVDPDFEITTDNAAVVARISQDLDGLPLAIELAAVRLKLLSPNELLARLGDRLGLLKGGGRDRPERQQTLRAAVQWSYELLRTEEQRLFRQVSVFAGGGSLDAAEAVYDGGGDLLDELASLLDKSLLRRSGDHEVRFTMLETLREFAGSALEEEGEAEGARRRHAAYFATLAEQAEPFLTSAGRGLWLDRLRSDLENLRAALAWFQEHDQEAGLLLAGHLSWFWYHEGHFREGRQWLEPAVTAKGVTPLVRARTLLGAARLAAYGGDEAAAVRSIDEILELTRAHDDLRHLAYALHFAGVLFAETDRARARPALREAVGIFRELDDTWGLALALSYEGMVAFHDGDDGRMEASLNEGSRLFRELDDPWGLAGPLLYRGLYHQRQGELQSASQLLEECEALLRRTGDRWRLATLLDKLAGLRIQQGHDPTPLLEERDSLLEDLGVVAAA